MNDEKEDNFVRNISLTVGLIASAAIAGTGIITTTTVAKPVVIDAGVKSFARVTSGGTGVPEICAKGTMVERAKAGQCWRDEQKKIWWVTCFGKFVHPRCLKAGGQ